MIDVSVLVEVARHEELRRDPVLGSDAHVGFRSSRVNVMGEALDARGMACQTLACPRCHLAVLRVFLDNRPVFFSIIRRAASGKSFLPASMSWRLRRMLPDTFRLGFTDVGMTGNQILNECGETLFGESDPGQLMGPTDG